MIVHGKSAQNRMNIGFRCYFAVPHKTYLMVGYLHGISSLFAAIMYGLMPTEGLIAKHQKKVLRVRKLCFNGFIHCVDMMDSEARFTGCPGLE